MEPATAEDRSRREWLAVAMVTAIGFGLRLWPIGRLGLTHFDEGIYALAASWSLQPKGLAALDPTVIPYAPPGYPILGGLAYWLLGRSDGAMIAVSQVAGMLTIPVVAWLARRTFGPGAGFASATFCAFSGPHIAFSRMALTDASFLLAWLLAIGAGMRFLERPGFLRAVVMGLAVGLAQHFKYNGWLAGGIVVASAGLGILVRPEERKVASILKTFGWGGLAAGVAWLVVWPWYAFVEAHGGYSALLRHQQNYLGGFRDWKGHFAVQMEQAGALSGGAVLPGLVLAIAFLGPVVAPGVAWASAFESRSLRYRVPIILGMVVVAWCFIQSAFWLGILMLPWLLRLPGGRLPEIFGEAGTAARVLGIAWLVLMIMTPFYHPYARLWLPIHALHWLLMAWLVGSGMSSILIGLRRWFDSSPVSLGLAFLLGLSLTVTLAMTAWPPAQVQPGLLAPSDSLYRAAVRVAEILPDEVKGLRLLARPPVTYYLAGRVALYPMAGSDSLFKGGGPGVWALVDSAILRSEAGGKAEGLDLLDRFANHWEVVEELPTNPSLPTLLDLDPTAARSASSDRTYPLWLLRPRTSKARR